MCELHGDITGTDRLIKTTEVNVPAQRANLHRPCPAHGALDCILCLKTTRTPWRDWTVAPNGHARQVAIEDRLDETARLTQRGPVLTYHPIAERPIVRSTTGGVTSAPTRQPGADASVAKTSPAARRTPRGGGPYLNRIFLLWEEADISKVGGQSMAVSVIALVMLSTEGLSSGLFSVRQFGQGGRELWGRCRVL